MPDVLIAVREVGENVPEVCVIVPPAKVIAPPVLEKVPRERVPPLTVIVPGRASSTPKASVPLVSVVAPVKVVFARAIVNVPPTPLRLSVPAPPMSVSSETAEVAVTLRAVAESTPVVPVRLPEENVTVPVAWLKAPRSSVPPPSVKALVPVSWLALPKASVPPLTFVVPVYEKVPDEAKVVAPEPIFVNPPRPLNVPPSVPPVVPVERLAPVPMPIVPEFVMTSIVSLPPSESVAAAAIVTPEVEERRLAPVVASVPALTFVAPV